jgi:hypothetical protein
VQTSRTNLQETLKEGGRGATADRSGTRCVGARGRGGRARADAADRGRLLIKSLALLQEVNPGFDARNLLTFSVAIPDAKYRSDTARIQYFERAIEAVRACRGDGRRAWRRCCRSRGGWSTGSFTDRGLPATDGQARPVG